MGTFGLGFGICSCSGRALFVRGSDDTLVGPLGRCVGTRDVPLAKNPSTGTAQQRLFLILKVVLHAVVVISEVLRLSTKSRCNRCCRHISSGYQRSSLVCLFCGCVLNCVYLINFTFKFAHYNEVVMFVIHSIRFLAYLSVLLRLDDPVGMPCPHINSLV